jgi:hypothetical protein
MKNLQNHRVPNTLTFEENAIIWYRSLLLNQAPSEDMTGFDTGMLTAFGMCPPVELAQYYQNRHTLCEAHTPKSGEMMCSKSCTQQKQIGTATTMMTAHRLRNFFLSFFMFFLKFIYLLRRNKLNIVSDKFNVNVNDSCGLQKLGV